MHVAKACKALWELSKAPAGLETYAKAAVLLDGLDKDNFDIDEGERVNGVARDKIRQARGWFQTLCGIGEGSVGEAGGYREDDVRGFIRSDLSQVQGEIAEGDGLHFKRWRAEANEAKA